MQFARLARAAVAFALGAIVIGHTPAAAQNYDGSGLLRVGAFAQGMWIDSGFAVTTVGPPVTTTTGTGSLEGFGGGISFGYDHRFGNFVLGVEADASFDNASKVIQTVDVGIDYFATFRGRLGFNVRPGLLIYATGGLALLGAEGKINISGTNFKTAKTFTGGTYGAGIEVDWSHLTFFVEYLHASFGSENFVFTTGENAIIDGDADVVRVGLKFKYGHDHSHDTYHRGSPMK
jgi:opacity protein-like surface antigen